MATRRVFLAVGQRFGRGVVVDPEILLPLNPGKERSGSKIGPRGALMRCDCGNDYKVIIGNLTSGNSQSCGCRRRDSLTSLGRKNTKHGLSRHPYFPRWNSMISRCTNPANPSYEGYGGRGITVTEAWHDPAVFIAYLETELGPCPEGHSLDRIDNDRGYEPGNVRWADPFTQRRNQRPYSGPKTLRTHCKGGHEFTPENTIRTKQGRRCRRCRNENARAKNRSEALRSRRTQMIPSVVLRQLIVVAERAAAAADPEAQEALEALELLRLYDMPIDVTDLPEALIS